MHLESLGADQRVRAAFEKFLAQGLTLARVAAGSRGQYRLYSEDAELEAEPSGAFWFRENAAPVAGDWVAARPVAPGQAIIEAVLPRRTCFSRRAPGRRAEEQAIAVNIDLVFLVCGLDGDWNPRRLERYVTLALESGADPVVVLNKADICADLPARIAEAAIAAGAAPVIPASTRSAGGLDALRTYLAPGRTVALLGSSGVGKSSIVNALLGEERLSTAEVRASDSRGRHTTTRRELVLLPEGGALIDTPGMREIQLWAGEDAVEAAFDEIAVLAAACRFADCRHQGEPGCAVAAAVERGDLVPERLASFRKLAAEARGHDEQARKRLGRIGAKALRQYLKLKAEGPSSG
jgi:ribosome biogenesis GTPase